MSQGQADPDDGEQSAGPVVTPLTAPRDGVPAVVDTPGRLAEAVDRLAGGQGPVAVDAERASGHRYGQRAFLVQLRRQGAGTVLIDPDALPDLSAVGAALDGAEWVLHAASQDLPCLAEVGMRPDTLFDTELAARLAGMARVGLAAVVEEILGLGLAKEHSAVDWSRRPLPEPWLRYAALDVEVLLDVRDALEARLAEQGKLELAREEFAAVAQAAPPAPRQDPWRRTSGIHRVRSRRQLAAVRELWRERDDLAREVDVSPGRLLPDAALVVAATATGQDGGPPDLMTLPGFTGRGAHRYARRWVAALRRARSLAEADLPPHNLPTDGPPPPRLWADRDPAAAVRLAAVRAHLGEQAERLGMPVENVLTPDYSRRLAWEPPQPLTAESLGAVLRGLGARRWQVELLTPGLVLALTPPAADQPQAEPDTEPDTEPGPGPDAGG